MTKSTVKNTLFGIGATAVTIALGYFGVQYIGKNNMFTIAAAVGGAGAISYVLQKPKEQPVSTQLEPELSKTKKRSKKV
ncbi:MULTISPECIES: hypothetical protein [Nostoc]|uniref:DUF3188 domain-containing protein n=1 Tax=Nostoc paludosum FACHB-159 TaxID=2692908 RepID=A0ABR8KID1_9NOSO|nr:MULTISPECIES: hypothetical protein [Nostoc]MBD2682280.1 hypothetical protein [Nostoc sp. FACHB-857]MBD2738614.1 hypothetical protein [Nostoc paludosum FACHB-159]